MIEPLYAVNFLKGHLQRFIKYKRINASIDCGDNYISFYAKDSIENKQYLARGSDHHLRMQHLANKDEPWKGDNISIVFITPESPQDSVVRATVQQNHYGGIKPFNVTIYQYNNTLLNERDLVQIFRAIISFLSGNGYNDPFKGTPKRAKPKQRTSNIKPYKEPPKKSRNISVDKDGSYDSANAWGADYVSESKEIYNYKTINCNKNMNRNSVVRLTESKLREMIKESVNTCLNEMHLDRNYTDEKGNKISGKKALKQQGENMWGVNNYNLDNSRAIYNQAKHLQVVLREFTKNLLRNPYNRNKPILPAPNGQEMYQDEIIDLAKRLEIALNGVLKTPHYGDYYNYSDYD